jgi:hypothetical protein
MVLMMLYLKNAIQQREEIYWKLSTWRWMKIDFPSFLPHNLRCRRIMIALLPPRDFSRNAAKIDDNDDDNDEWRKWEYLIDFSSNLYFSFSTFKGQ